MENKEPVNDKVKEMSDRASASKVKGGNGNESFKDDAYKTPNRKHKQEWSEPLDEQMHDDKNLKEE